MKTRQYSLLILLLAISALLFAACQPGLAPTRTVACSTHFEATVHHGPSAGLAVTGTLLFFLDHSGALNGVVVTADGSEINASGQANGRAINLAFQVGEQKYIFGVGSAENPITSCTGYWGGGFTGPEPGDSGDWLAADGSDVTLVNADIALDPNIVPVVINEGGSTITNSGSPDITQNFTCGETTCRCTTAEDCKRLSESGICRTSFRSGVPNQVCTYRDGPSRRTEIED